MEDSDCLLCFGRPPAYAFVSFDDYYDAEAAVRGRDGVMLEGQRLRVEMSLVRATLFFMSAECLCAREGAVVSVLAICVCVVVGGGSASEGRLHVRAG